MTAKSEKNKFALLASSSVNAGFPSPAADYMEGELDLNKLLIKNIDATFFIRVNGDSMIDVGIFDNDVLVVDRSLTARNGSIILAVVEEEFTVKKLIKKGTKTYLAPANQQYQAIDVTDNTTFQVWGVITSAIHKFQ